MTPKEKAEIWLNSNIDQESRESIELMLKDSDENDLVESFYKDLEFGTGGLRGIMGVGSNRMNQYTVGAATQGLSNYLNKIFPGEEISVAIAHDSRNNSRYFAETTASVFSANGIKVYFFDGMRPTPELSFAIRHFGCKSGVVVTASHNPKEYNGYKAYWEDGGQVTPPHDSNIINEVKSITSLDDINFNTNEDLIQNIGDEVDDIYIGKIKELVLSPESIAKQSDIKIVYSPIHGTGVTLVPRILEEIGFKNVFVVEQQAIPDGNFPTVVYPNPEEAEALTLALEKAKEIDADLIMATDPDADRVGIAVKNNHDEWQLLNGNQTACLLVNYVLNKWKESGELKGNEFIVKTIVTTNLLEDIAKGNGVEFYTTLTGFKYIATVIRELEGKKSFLVGGEESYGYMIGDFVRDKDAIASCAMIAELTADARANGKTVFEQLIDIYIEYGFYLEKLVSLTKKGKDGAEEIQKMMKEFRNDPPEKLGGSKVIKVLDYLSATEKDLIEGTVSTLEFPKSNVLQFFLEDGSKISARPSGTEPKIKFYFSVKENLDSQEDYDQTLNLLKDRINRLENDLIS